MPRSWDEDESIPLFFILRALALVIAPWTILVIRELRSSARSEPSQESSETAKRSDRQVVTKKTRKAAKEPAAELHPKSRIFKCGFCLRTSVLLAIWVWFMLVIKQYLAALAQNALYEGFDPYGILNVDNTTGRAELSRAYRREAVKHHPDKSSDPAAAEKFMLVRKAFDSLTDPEAMRNFQAYGNPDGPQIVRLFAIPSFIKDKDASRVDGKLRYKPRYFRAADLQFQLLLIVFSLLVAVVVCSSDLITKL